MINLIESHIGIIACILLIMFISVLIVFIKTQKKLLKLQAVKNDSIEQFLDITSEEAELLKTTRKKMMISFRNYKDIKVLATGGMGAIFSAFDTERSRKVAIKTILPQLESQSGIVDLFLRECQVIQAMNHTNIIRIFEVGEKDDLYFYVMDYVDGENLQDVMDVKKKLSIADALKSGIQITRGLRHIHSNGLIHRDIKPSNILLTPDHVVKIIDFGIARLLGVSSESDNQAGSPLFASPEQIQGEQITGRSDIYSFGICMYYLISGQFPFPKGDMLAKLLQDPVPLKKIVPEISDQLNYVIRSCLKRDAQARPSAHELWVRLRSVTG